MLSYSFPPLIQWRRVKYAVINRGERAAPVVGGCVGSVGGN